MLIERITSRQNPLVKRFRRVRLGTERQFLLLEGVRLVSDALHGGVHFETIAFAPSLESTERGAKLLAELQRVPCRGALVTAQVMSAITDTDTPQGVAAIVSRPHFNLSDIELSGSGIVVIADHLQDPGNLGSTIRTSEAAGAELFITTRHTADPYSLKALRGSTGSALRLPICSDVKPQEAIDFCKHKKIPLIATNSKPAKDAPLADAALVRPVLQYTQLNLKEPFALVLGQEAAGVSAEISAVADVLVHIPMAAGVESLNVAAAASVLLYEAARQRGFAFEKGAV